MWQAHIRIECDIPHRKEKCNSLASRVGAGVSLTRKLIAHNILKSATSYCFITTFHPIKTKAIVLAATQSLGDYALDPYQYGCVACSPPGLKHQLYFILNYTL
jgi:hypothetical protein